MPRPGLNAGDTGPEPSPDMAAILARLEFEDAAMPDPTTVPPDQAREIAELTNRRWNRDQPKMRQIDDLAFPGPDGHVNKARLFTPEDVKPGLIFFIHGGGFALCSIDTHERCARSLAIAAECAVLSVSYRLAPEHPFPDGLNDCVSTFGQVERVQRSHPWTDGPVAISGDSAGANLALALMLNQQKHGRPAPDAALLFYGVYGCDFHTRSYTEFENGPGLTRAKMMRYFDWYAPQRLRNDPGVAPLNASDAALGALPPLYLNAAEIDPLCTDTTDLAARLRGLGRNDRVRIFRGVVHGFMMMTPSLPAARQAIAEAGNAFRQFVDR